MKQILVCFMFRVISNDVCLHSSCSSSVSYYSQTFICQRETWVEINNPDFPEPPRATKGAASPGRQTPGGPHGVGLQRIAERNRASDTQVHRISLEPGRPSGQAPTQDPKLLHRNC
ncbi:hypothetical protein ATANTOWER_014525 [Ataeniobius toweri]|uniref:Secreted protein n=1 Tax=Ataeniobius toweri TaxID=208326 RepID=A0ABU7BYL7_9TELE|nr:hypothetical protein [Ataeniobius toweri]